MKRSNGRRFGMFALYAVAALLIGADAAGRHAPGDPIQSSSFQLVDGNGQVRGQWAWHEATRMAELAMYDGQGRARYSLFVDDAGKTVMMILSPQGASVIDARVGAEGDDPSINLYRTSGKGELHLGFADEQSSPAIMFQDKNKMRRMWLGFDDDDRASIELADGQGTPRISLKTMGDGTSYLGFWNKDGKIALDIGHSDDEDDGPHMRLFRGDQELGAALYLVPRRLVGLNLYDREGRLRSELLVDEKDRPRHTIYGDDRKELFVIPPNGPPRKGK